MHSQRKAMGPWRQRVFWGWVGAGILVAAYALVVGPVVAYYQEGLTWVAMASPAVMFFMLITGLFWLWWAVTSRPTRDE